MSDETGMVFNGPVETNMDVMVVNENTNQAGVVTIGLGYFTYPTPQFIEERLKKMEANEFEGALEGFRLMTKEEAWSQVMAEKTGPELQ